MSHNRSDRSPGNQVQGEGNTTTIGPDTVSDKSQIGEAMLEARKHLLKWGWEDIIPRIVSPFTTFQEILRIRQLSRTMYYSRRFRLSSVSLKPFAWIAETVCWHNTLPLAMRILTPGAFQRLNFSGCTNLTETFFFALFSDLTILPTQLMRKRVLTLSHGVASEAPVDNADNPQSNNNIPAYPVSTETAVTGLAHPPSDTTPLYPPVRNHSVMECTIKELIFDGCAQLSDRFLTCLLELRMPLLEKLSLRCARTLKLTGEPFAKMHKNEWASRWPRFHQFDGAFTHMTLEAFDKLASFCLARSIEIGTTASVVMLGSMGSIAFFKVLGLDILHSDFSSVLESGNLDFIRKELKRFEAHYAKQVESNSLKRMVICKLLKAAAIQLVVNAPRPMETKERRELTKFSPEDHSKERKVDASAISPIDLNAGTHHAKDELPIDYPQEKSTRWTYPLYTAIRIGDRDVVKHLIKVGAWVDASDYDGATPMYVATLAASMPSVTRSERLRSCRLGCMEDLVAAGSLIDSADVNNKKWPICAAAKRNDIEIIKFLLNADALVNFPGRRYGNLAGGSGPKSPLSVACDAEPLATKAIRLLVSNGADVVGQARPGAGSGNSSPLLVIYRREPQLLPEFIKNIPDEELRQLRKMRPPKNEDVVAHLCPSTTPAASFLVLAELSAQAITRKDAPTIKMLIEMIPSLLTIRHSVWGYPISQACKVLAEEGMQMVVDAYLKHDQKAFFHHKDQYGREPLLVAVQEQNQSAVRVLLKAGCSLNTTDAEGYSGFNWACMNNYSDMMEFLAKNGADCNQAALDGSTPLISSIKHRRLDIVIRLLDYKTLTSLDAQDKWKRNALIYAIQMGLYDIGVRLISEGASCTAVDEEGLDALAHVKRVIDGRSGGIRATISRKLGRRRGSSSNASITSKSGRGEKGHGKQTNGHSDGFSCRSSDSELSVCSSTGSTRSHTDATNGHALSGLNGVLSGTVSVSNEGDGEQHCGFGKDATKEEIQDLKRSQAKELQKLIQDRIKEAKKVMA